MPVCPSKLPPLLYTFSIVLVCTSSIDYACTFSRVVGEKTSRENLQRNPPAPLLVPEPQSLPTVFCTV